MSLEKVGDGESPLLDQYKVNRDSFNKLNQSYDYDPVSTPRDSERFIGSSDAATNSEIKQEYLEQVKNQGPARASSLLGGESVKLSFTNLSYTVTIRSSREQIREGEPRTKKLQILKNVTGYCLPGQSTFIMGASGAGKTSLLNLLSDRVSVNKGDSIEGQITFNDKHALNEDLFGNYASYVMQDDCIFQYFTVKEALTFAARLKLHCNEDDQNKRVETLIQDLGLQECSDTMVGSITKKTISGGERKRTAIGIELITDPKLILLDEPTSGLDSFTTERIVKCLQGLARKRNKTIVCTIHQPSSQAYSYCDRLLLLADGYMVYQGPANQVGDYFDMATRSKMKNRNPCDFFMRELAINYPKSQEDEQKIANFTKKYEREISPLVQKEMQELQYGELDLKRAAAIGIPFKEQLKLLRWRMMRKAKLEPRVFASKILGSVIAGILINFLYWDIGGKYDYVNMKNMSGLCFSAVANQFIPGVNNAILTFQLEREVFLREQAKKLYSPLAYYITMVAFETLLMLVTPLIIVLIEYWAIGFNNAAGASGLTFFQIYLALMLVGQVSMSIGMIISAFSSSL